MLVPSTPFTPSPPLITTPFSLVPSLPGRPIEPSLPLIVTPSLPSAPLAIIVCSSPLITTPSLPSLPLAPIVPSLPLIATPLLPSAPFTAILPSVPFAPSLPPRFKSFVLRVNLTVVLLPSASCSIDVLTLPSPSNLIFLVLATFLLPVAAVVSSASALK